VGKRPAVVVSVGVVALASVSAVVAGSTGTVLKIRAQKAALKYNVTTLRAAAGAVSISMSNPSTIFKHNVAIKGNGVSKKGAVVGKGGTSKVVVTLKPGRYTFYCSVPGHEAGGMKGTLIVTK
jgi:plastocyanin